MLFVEVTGWLDPPHPLGGDPVSLSAQALADQGLGEVGELEQRLQSLPERVGPFASYAETEAVNRLLMGFGAKAMVVESD